MRFFNAFNLIFLFVILLLFNFPLRAQLCSGTLGAPIFFEDFGAGVSVYGPPLAVGTTNYPYLQGPPNNGTYVIANTADPSNTVGYVPDNDHTGNPNGYMMVVNSDYAPDDVYRKDVTGLCPNTTYVFSSFLANNNTPTATANCATYIYANVMFQVEYPQGTIQGSVSSGNLPLASSNTTLNWGEYGFVFTTGVNQTSCSVVLINNAPGGCGNDYVVDDISLSPCGPGLSVNVFPNDTVCPGQSAIFQSTFTVGSYTIPQYQWQYSTNGSSWNDINGATSSNYSLSAASQTNSGMYRLLAAENGNISLANCRIIAGPVTFTVSDFNLSVNSTSICSSRYATLTAVPASLTSYTWSNGVVSSSVVVNPLTTTIYTLSANFGVCTNSTSATVSVSPTPTISIVSVSICPGLNGTLNANGAASYTWYPGISTGSSFTANPPSTTVYSVNGLSAVGCSASATASMVVQPTPTLSFVTATITCANLGSATVTPSGGIGPFSYSWNPTAQTSSIATGLYPAEYTVSVFDNYTGCSVNSYTTIVSLLPFTGTVVASDSLRCNGVPNGTASINLSGGSGSQNYLWTNPVLGTQTGSLASSLSAGIHTVFVSDGITFCNVTHTFSIEEPTPLNLNVIANPPLACVGTSVTLLATNSGGTPGYNYTWTPGPVSASRTATEINGGAYVYTVQSQDAYSCSINNTVAVTFVDYPVMTASVDTICVGAYATLSVSGASSYTWRPGNVTGVNFYPNPLSNTSYTVIGSILGCNDTLVRTVVVNPLPIPVIVGNSVVCQDQTINLTGSGGVAYNWIGPLGIGSTNQNMILNSVALNKSGVYSLTVTSVDGCKAATSISVTVLPKPIVNVVGSAVCIGMSSTLSASGGTAFLWSGPDGFSSTQASVNIPTVSSTNSGVYTVVVTGSNSCISTASVQLIGYPFPLPIPVITTPSLLCLNSSFTLQGSGGGTYSWAGPGGFSSNQQSPDLIAGNFGMSGIYTLSVRSASNCVASTSASLTILPLPKGNLISSLREACIPFCSNFNLDITSQIYPIVSSIFFINGAATADTAFKFCFINEGSFVIKSVLTDVNGCSSTNTLGVLARPLPKADFSYSPLNPVENIDYVYFADASTGDRIHSWSWFFTSNTDSSLVQNPQYLYSKAGVYPIALTVKNKWGCADTIVKTIEVINDFSFYLPNSFTPNGDGINDIFQPKGVGIVKFSMEIYDRWGEKIFSTEDFYKGWDGSFKGKECKTDTYIWKARVTNPAGKNLDYSGHVNILEN